MLAVAKTENSGAQFIRADINDLSGIPGKYDMVFSSLAIHDVVDFDKLCDRLPLF